MTAPPRKLVRFLRLLLLAPLLRLLHLCLVFLHSLSFSRIFPGSSWLWLRCFPSSLSRRRTLPRRRCPALTRLLFSRGSLLCGLLRTQAHRPGGKGRKVKRRGWWEGEDTEKEERRGLQSEKLKKHKPGGWDQRKSRPRRLRIVEGKSMKELLEAFRDLRWKEAWFLLDQQNLLRSCS